MAFRLVADSDADGLAKTRIAYSRAQQFPEFIAIILSEADGLFYPLVQMGYHVQKDELVGYLTDFFGKTIQEVRAPYDGIVLYIIATPPMSKGEPMTSIGRF